MKLNAKVCDLEDFIRQTRRALHRIPETGYSEHKTQAYIWSCLEQFSPDSMLKIADTGVKAVYYANNAYDACNAVGACNEAETIAFRADIDALAMTECNKDIDYASEHEGCMHACGHDGHTATLLALAKLVSENRQNLNCNVVLLFQPAEEYIGGAVRMVAEGALENPKVDKIFGMHVWPDVPQGMIGYREGPMMAQTCEFDITVNGKSAHGASPHKGIDAIVASAFIISSLQTIITRSVDPYEKALITIGRIEGGEARNIIADKVTMNGTIRTFDNGVNALMQKRIGEILKGSEISAEVKTDYNVVMRYPMVNNPVPMAEYLAKIMGYEDIVVVDEQMAAEDFSFYQQIVPGMFFLVGIGSPCCKHALHNSMFDFDEKALLCAVEIYRRILSIDEPTKAHNPS